MKNFIDFIGIWENSLSEVECKQFVDFYNLCENKNLTASSTQDLNPANRSLPILGANDGASGIAILMTIAEIINQNLIKVKVWERGAGQTKACGTAACATAVAGNINGFTKTITDIEFELGKLSIFLDEKNSIHMKGPVSEIKEIDIKL